MARSSLSTFANPKDELTALLDRRVLLITGKGGVGKTVVSAALARAIAARGKRVLAIEIGDEEAAPSPLATALGAASSNDIPIEVCPGVHCVRIVPSMGHHAFLRDALPMKILADAAMKAVPVRRFLSAAPTLAEMGVLYRLLELSRERLPDGSLAHEVLIVDLPATGHALALTQLPAVMLKLIPGGPIVAAVKEGLALVQDAKATAAVVVTLPEALPVSEALELRRGLESHQVPVGAIVLNRAPHNPFTQEERAALRDFLEGKPQVMGRRSLARIERADAAFERIRAEHRSVLFVVPELDDDENLTRKLASFVFRTNELEPNAAAS